MLPRVRPRFAAAARGKRPPKPSNPAAPAAIPWSEATAALFAANPNLPPHFSRCNSGSPRCNPHSKHPGKKAPRGPSTFLPADRFEQSVGAVIEATFRGTVHLNQTSASDWTSAKNWLA